jgi:hypothetical protein
MKSELVDWLCTAKQTEEALQKAIDGFATLSDSYEGIRNVGYEDDEKEAIDEHYRIVTELRDKLCDLQAGGKRRKRSIQTRKQKQKKRQ